MTIKKIYFLGALFVVCSCSESGQVELTNVDKKVLQETENLNEEPEGPCPRLDPSQFEGDWTIWTSFGDIGHGDNLTIKMLNSSPEEFLVKSSAGNEAFENVFTAECIDDRNVLNGIFNSHGCNHTVTIARGLNNPEETVPEIYNKHINIKFSHPPQDSFPVEKGCRDHTEDLHGGVAHGGGTGAN